MTVVRKNTFTIAQRPAAPDRRKSWLQVSRMFVAFAKYGTKHAMSATLPILRIAINTRQKHSTIKIVDRWKCTSRETAVHHIVSPLIASEHGVDRDAVADVWRNPCTRFPAAFFLDKGGGENYTRRIACAHGISSRREHNLDLERYCHDAHRPETDSRC